MKHCVRVLAFLGLLIAAVIFAGPAEARRVALVIGNAAYKVGPLANPINDADAVAAAFAGLGFDTTLRKNLGIEAMRRELSAFGRKAAGAEMAVVFFAGHGTEMAGRNYLIPVDATLERAADIELEAVGLETVIAQLDGATLLKLVILDACRNNIFPMAGAKRSMSRGLARIEPGGNTLVAYAAKEGTLADDGTGARNSPFTTALLKNVALPGIDIRLMFGGVRDDVLAATNGQQEPYLYGTAGRQAIYLKAAASAPLPGPAATRPPQSPVPQPAPTPARETASATAAAADRARSVVPGWGEPFRDCYDTDPVRNRICPEMVVVPAGSLMMGSPPDEAARASNEGPPHRVTFSRPFAVGKFEVTFDEWEACVAGGGCRGNSDPSDEGWGKGRRPVIGVSWDDAKEYVAWLSDRTGRSYRLLSEAEWEYAARAGAITRYAWGNDIGHGNANCDGCRSQWVRQTAPVGPFKPNAWGLHDVHGNVGEWVEDCWNDSYAGAPTDGSAWLSGVCRRRVIRGGSWQHDPARLRSASRDRATTVTRTHDVGFRVGRSITP